MTTVLLDALLVGQIQPFRGADEPSAIAKQPVPGPLRVEAEGLVGDTQADRRYHGGPDKALHHYPYDHYGWWRERLGDHPDLAAPGAFGENMSTRGLTEADVRLGDRFRLGTALIEVSHGRQPCWKLGHRLGRPDVAAQVVKSRRSGWYYRVLEPGTVQAGDALTLVEPGLADWSVERLFAVLIGGAGRKEPAALRYLAGLPVLAQAWRERAVELLG